MVFTFNYMYLFYEYTSVLCLLRKILEGEVGIALGHRQKAILSPTMIRPWSENDPRMKPSARNPPRNRGYFSSSPRAFSIGKYNLSRPILHSNMRQVLRLPRKVTIEPHQIPHLPRKMIGLLNPRHT